MNNINPDRSIDMEDEALKMLEEFKDTRKAFNNIPACNYGKLNQYVIKWKRVRELKQERLTRMEDCLRRQNNRGRGFEPCRMPNENNMPQSCSTPLDVYFMLQGSNPSVGSTANHVIPERFLSLLADPTASARHKRAVFDGPSHDSVFGPIDRCLVDRCGCPEIEMCEKCHEVNRYKTELIGLEQQLLYMRWECGLTFKNQQ
jgi:hypothetical protein